MCYQDWHQTIPCHSAVFLHTCKYQTYEASLAKIIENLASVSLSNIAVSFQFYKIMTYISISREKEVSF